MREMKDSGVEWIGEIPKDWSTIRLKYLLTKKKNSIKVGPFGSQIKGNDFVDEGVPVYTQRTVLDDDFINGDAFITKEKYSLLKGFEVEPLDFLITTRGSIGRVAIAPEDVRPGIIHPCIIKFTIDRNIYNDQLLKYIFNGSDMILEQLVLASNATTIPVVYSEPLKNVIIPMAPYNQQQKIVRYLNEECTKIDAVIKKQQAIIEKLKEYKLSIIAEGVTKGIDCKAEFKDSGIEWIGKIPKHWTVTKMKQVALFFNGDRSSKYPSGEDIVDEGVFFITSNNLGEIVLDTSIETNKYITHSKYQELGGAKIRMNDIIFCLRGSVGKCAINKSITEGTIASSLVDIRATGINPDFLNMVLHTTGVTTVASVNAIGIGSLNLAATDISEVVIPLPPAKEAEEIAERLSNKTAEIDKKISIHEKLINQLNDFKRSLIYEMVSGKKQVL